MAKILRRDLTLDNPSATLRSIFNSNLRETYLEEVGWFKPSYTNWAYSKFQVNGTNMFLTIAIGGGENVYTATKRDERDITELVLKDYAKVQNEFVCASNINDTKFMLKEIEAIRNKNTTLMQLVEENFDIMVDNSINKITFTNKYTNEQYKLNIF